MSLKKRTQVSLSSILASAVLVTMVSATSPVPLSQSNQNPEADKLELAKKSDAVDNKSGGTTFSPAPSREGEPSATRPNSIDPALTQPTGLPDGSPTGDSVNTTPPETDTQQPTR